MQITKIIAIESICKHERCENKKLINHCNVPAKWNNIQIEFKVWLESWVGELSKLFSLPYDSSVSPMSLILYRLSAVSIKTAVPRHAVSSFGYPRDFLFDELSLPKNSLGSGNPLRLSRPRLSGATWVWRLVVSFKDGKRLVACADAFSPRNDSTEELLLPRRLTIWPLEALLCELFQKRDLVLPLIRSPVLQLHV